MFDIRRRNSPLSTPFCVAITWVIFIGLLLFNSGFSPGARMGFSPFVQGTGVMATPESFQDLPLAPKLKHQCSFVKKPKAPGNFPWCKLGFPVQISPSRLTKKIPQCDPAELFSLECHGQLVHRISAFALGVGRNNPSPWSHRAGLGAQGKHG